MADTPGDEGFLPPEPAGPEPDLGETQPAPPPPPQPPPPQPQVQPPQQAWGPPNAGFPMGPQPGYQPPQPPPGYYQQPQGWQQPAWAPPLPAQPDNGPAVTGFVLTLVSAGLWMFTAGLSSIVSIVCAGLGIFYSRRGKQKVDSGETQKHKSLAQAGYIGGIVMVVLATLSTLAWIAFAILYATDESFQDEIDGTSDAPATTQLGLAALRLVRLGLLG